MPLTVNDLQALRSLFLEEIEPFRIEVNKRFDTVMDHFDALYQANEKREQEYFFITNQLQRLENRTQILEKKAQ